MRKWAFTVRFHAILLPYNTLNLLTSAIDIKRCLTTCRQHLKPDGVLLLQLYIATAERMASEKKTFQFRMLDHPDGGRVIKEIRQGYKKQGKLMEIEERFRIRPSMPGAEKDYQTFYAIAALPVDAWLALFQEAGFSHEGLYNHARDLTPILLSTALCTRSSGLSLLNQIDAGNQSNCLPKYMWIDTPIQKTTRSS